MNGSGDTPGIQGISIVARGSFNPAIFQPRWFSSHNLIRDEEATVAEKELQIIHREATIFSAEWFSLKVSTDAFILETTDPTKSHALRDLVVGTFRILEHTPVESFGLNMHRHYAVSSLDEWHAFGNHYAPKDSWNEIIIEPGMVSLAIQGKRKDCAADQLQVKIEPSTRTHPGVYIGVNQHYQLDKDEKTSQESRMAFFLRTVSESLDDFISYCDLVSKHLFKEYRGGTNVAKHNA